MDGVRNGRSGNRAIGTAALAALLPALLAVTAGCQIYGRPQRTTTQEVMLEANCPSDPAKMPAKELAKVTLPAYVIEPPDILLVDALRVVPKPPFRIQSFDTLQVIVEGTLLEQPINGLYVVEPGGLLEALHEVVRQPVIAREGEPRPVECRDEPGIAHERSRARVDEEARMAQRRDPHPNTLLCPQNHHLCAV